MDDRPGKFTSLRTLGESGEIVIEKSRFYGYARRADTEREALSFIDDCKSRHPGHSCTCHAYVCGMGGNLQRFHDGHEPVGGMPILECIKLNGATNTVCAVVRYFGGTKLGKGGLARAFAAAAKSAVESAGICDYILTKRLELTFDYSHTGRVSKYIEDTGFIREETLYTNQVTTRILVKSLHFLSVIDTLNDITSGNGRVEEAEEIYYAWQT